MTQVQIDDALVTKLLGIIDQGLVAGVGKPVPGQLCIEAAVCLAMGLPHGDEPSCVAPSLRRLKIGLNDARWSSKAARAKGLRRLGVAQLGSAGALDEREFARRCGVLAIQVAVPFAMRVAAKHPKLAAHKDALLAVADMCEKEPTRANAERARADAAYAAAAAAAAAAYAADDDAAYAAAAAAYAAADAAAAYAYDRDKFLSDFAERVVQILIDLKAPGCQWLALTEAA